MAHSHSSKLRLPTKFSLDLGYILPNLLIFAIAINKFSALALISFMMLIYGLFHKSKVDTATLIPLFIMSSFLMYYAFIFGSINESIRFLLPLATTLVCMWVLSLKDFNSVSDFSLAISLFVIYLLVIIIELTIWSSSSSRAYTIAKIFENYQFSANRISAGLGLIAILLATQRNSKTYIVISFIVLTAIWTAISGSRLSFLVLAAILIYNFINFRPQIKLLSLFCFASLTYSLFTIYTQQFVVLYWRISNALNFSDNRIRAFDNHSASCILNIYDQLFGKFECIAKIESTLALDNFFSLTYFSLGVSGLIVFIVAILSFVFCLKLTKKYALIALLWMFVVYNLDESIVKVEFLNPIAIFFILHHIHRSRIEDLQKGLILTKHQAVI